MVGESDGFSLAERDVCVPGWPLSRLSSSSRRRSEGDAMFDGFIAAVLGGQRWKRQPDNKENTPVNATRLVVAPKSRFLDQPTPIRQSGRSEGNASSTRSFSAFSGGRVWCSYAMPLDGELRPASTRSGRGNWRNGSRPAGQFSEGALSRVNSGIATCIRPFRRIASARGGTAVTALHCARRAYSASSNKFLGGASGR